MGCVVLPGPGNGELRGDPAGAHWDIVTKSPRQRDAPPLSQSDDTHTLKYSNVSTTNTNIKIFQLESQLAGAMGTCRETGRYENPMIILGTVKNIMIFKVVVNQLDNPVYGGSPTPPQSAPVLLTLKSIMLIHSQQ